MTTGASRVDLHAHTTASDGVHPPAELVRVALDAGLTHLGVTDHDSTEGLSGASSAAQGTGLTIVPGVELSTDVPDGEVHVLGYYVDHTAPDLQSRLAVLREGRLRRGERIVELLNAAGVPLELDRVLAFAGKGAVGRPHVARALVEAGYAESIDDAFGRYLIKGRPGYAERQRFTPTEAVETILAAGGVPVLAHPFHGVADDDAKPAVEARIADLVGFGLKGVEVYYVGYEGDARGFLLSLARRHGLIVTGGSDYHGPGRAELGSVPMPQDVQATVVDDLRSARSSGRR